MPLRQVAHALPQAVAVFQQDTVGRLQQVLNTRMHERMRRSLEQTE
jgi:hypothetical protein